MKKKKKKKNRKKKQKQVVKENPSLSKNKKRGNGEKNDADTKQKAIALAPYPGSLVETLCFGGFFFEEIGERSQLSAIKPRVFVDGRLPLGERVLVGQQVRVTTVISAVDSVVSI